MRKQIAVAVFGLGLTLAAPAHAADLPQFSATEYSYAAVRAEPVVIGAFEPGVVSRAYWLAPWENHHYFPFTGKRPHVGRIEKLSARSAPLPRAASFYRSWSTEDLISHEPRGEAPLPRRTIPQHPTNP